MRNIGFFPLWMIERHRGERGGGARTAGASHPARREAKAGSVLLLARVDLSMFESSRARVKGGMVSDLAFNCLLIYLLIAYWIKGGIYSNRKGTGPRVFVLMTLKCHRDCLLRLHHCIFHLEYFQLPVALHRPVHLSGLKCLNNCWMNLKRHFFVPRRSPSDWLWSWPDILLNYLGKLQIDCHEIWHDSHSPTDFCFSVTSFLLTCTVNYLCIRIDSQFWCRYS